jgi:hypothetical protein
LPPTATLTTSDRGDLMLSCRKRGTLSYTCPKACSVPVCSMEVPDVKVVRVDPFLGSEAKVEAGGFGDTLMGWMKRGVPAPITAGVRAGGNPADAVVLAEGEKIHLAPALTRVLEGEYCFTLTPLDPAGNRTPLTFRMSWNRETEPEGLVALKVPPGAYALEKQTRDSSGKCNADPDAVAAWIVIAARPAFTALTDRWKQDRSWLNDLSKSGVSPAVVVTARHAMIAELSESPGDASH